MKRARYLIAEDAIGFIDREVWHPETPEEQPEALHRMLSVGCHDPDRRISDDVAEMRERIDAGLARMGWPPSCVRLAVSKEGTPRVIDSPEELREGEGFSWSFAWIEKNATPLSEAYFLGKMAWSLQVIEWSLEKADMMTVFRHAMRLGAYQTEIDVRRIALRAATVGKGQLAASERGRAIRSADSFKTLYGAEAQQRANALYRENPRRTWARIREILAAEYEVSVETIKKALSNPKKSG